ncbi:MAG TPA: aldolase/citrate lyase family protein [Patescibacteria group bacterium]|nr:aldolase/citrate lyase family protein [Patescibacteria group bacterium]
MRNKIKEALLAGKPVLGLSIMIPSPHLVEMAGNMGFEWVLIDCEHGSISLETAELMIMAAEVSNTTPIVRPPKNDPEIILQYMDRGAMGIQAPHVANARQAEEIVAAVKYHPLGSRSLAVGTRSAHYGFKRNIKEYAQEVNRETLVCVQIEDREGLEHITPIANVAGVDVVFLGPTDLSQSLGYPGEVQHPVVQEALQQAFSAIHQTGKTSGTAGNFENAVIRLNQGVGYYYTHLTTLLARSSSELFTSLRSPV